MRWLLFLLPLCACGGGLRQSWQSYPVGEVQAGMTFTETEQQNPHTQILFQYRNQTGRLGDPGMIVGWQCRAPKGASIQPLTFKKDGLIIPVHLHHAQIKATPCDSLQRADCIDTRSGYLLKNEIQDLANATAVTVGVCGRELPLSPNQQGILRNLYLKTYGATRIR